MTNILKGMKTFSVFLTYFKVYCEECVSLKAYLILNQTRRHMGDIRYPERHQLATHYLKSFTPTANFLKLTTRTYNLN